jgi:hypothetical protein
MVGRRCRAAGVLMAEQQLRPDFRISVFRISAFVF